MRGPNGEELPGAALFACTMNAVRSPMAAAIMRHLYGRFVYVESAGARAGELDAMAVEVMEEVGIEIGKHKPRRFEDLEDTSFDLIVTLSPEAHHKAMELTRTMAVAVEYWPTVDPTAIEGSRDQRLDAYRAVRDELMQRIEARFAVDRAGDA
jgi:protein-tyrosine-phosphatase